ncbi:MAG: Fe-S protein assembly co-chaperone HscB [Pseudomonadota bacterium]|nr:Fe-S protein assembly co-chaperone HscB [Pseudomonadota bacterium]MDE3037308.1 Fe-S protein assembly co-chaperone HscB [Pseudomonadota bacterium]
MNYFEILNLPVAFDLDLRALDAAYFKAQREHHPDRVAGKRAHERQAALQRSGDINAAYETLKSPLKRAQYLLSLQGITVGTDNDSVRPSPGLLQETLEWREKIEESDAEKLTKLDNSLKAMQEKSTVLIASHYMESRWEMMTQETLRLRYIMKAREAIVILRRGKAEDACPRAMDGDTVRPLRVSQDEGL